MLKVLKLYPRLLIDEGLINGAFFQPELHIGFYPCQPGDDTLKVAEALLPHLNMLVTTRCRPDWHWARKCWEIWRLVCRECGIMRSGIGYPDLFVGRRMDQPRELSGWLSYSLKAPPCERFYTDGIKNGCHRAHLNMQFRQSVYHAIGSWRRVLQGPWQLGNLHPNSRDRYLGQRRPTRTMERAIIERLKLIRRGDDQQVELTGDEWDILDLMVSPDFLRYGRVIRLLKKQRAENNRTYNNSA